MNVVAQKTQELINENARIVQNQTEYEERYGELVDRYDGIQARYDEVIAAIRHKEALAIRLDEFVIIIEARDGVLEEFDDTLWGYIVEYVEVGRKKELKFRLIGGIEMTV